MARCTAGTVVSRSSTTWVIETFMTVVSSTITNWAVPRMRMVARFFTALASEHALDLADGRSLSLADLLAALTVRGRDPLRQAEHEAPIVVQLLRRGLALEQLDGLLQLTEAVLPQLVQGAVAGAVHLRLRRDHLVEQLALAVLLAGL